MKISTQLSVSSVILAAFLSGCSQQVAGGSQMSAGSSQMAGSGQVSSQSQIEGNAQVGSQQQVESTPVVIAPAPAPRPVYRAPVEKPTVKRTVRRSGIGLPPAKPGQCFAKVRTPAKYVTKSRKVLVRKASSKRVLVRGPQYGWTTKRVLVRKASYKTRTIPAQYKTVSKRVMVKPAHYIWSKKAQGKVVRIDNMTGEVLCRVKVPAVYKTVTHKVQVRPARTVRKLVPAVYKTVKIKKLLAPAKYKVVTSPAQYKTQHYRVKVGNSRIVWRQVMCKTHKSYRKHYKKTTYRKPVRQYQHKAAPNRVIHRAATKYRKPTISQREYYAVMNAGKKVSHKAAPRRATQSSAAKGISVKEYYSVMKAPMPKHKAAAKKASAKKKHVKHTSPKKMMETVKPQTKAPEKATKAKADTTADTKANETKTSNGMSGKTEAKAAATDSQKQMSKANIIRSIQKALKEKGFDPGPVDGKMGPGTAAALKAFQSSHGLPVGRLTKDTFRALGLIR